MIILEVRNQSDGVKNILVYPTIPSYKSKPILTDV